MLVESNGIAKFVKEELPEQQLSTSSAIPEVQGVSKKPERFFHVFSTRKNIKNGQNSGCFYTPFNVFFATFCLSVVVYLDTQ
jgi:hypothetical protein